MHRVVRTDRADENLIEIWSYIAADSAESADRTLDAIERRWRQLGEFPLSGLARDDIAPGVRCLVVGNYLTLHLVGADVITILRVLHARRKIDRASIKDLPGLR